MLISAAAALLARTAVAATNASSAAAFIENAQNADGGFSEAHGAPASTAASLWATVALLAAGKNPADEKLNNGSSAQDYLAAHLAAYHSLTDLGLLAVIQAASGADSSRYGDPGTQVRADLTTPAIHSDPGGAAMGVIGLLALRANADAATVARTLETVEQPDGGWGTPGDTDSASTALVLEAIAQSGVAGSSDPVVRRGIAYLHTAQVNDGSIAVSDRTDASSSGDVAATAFTIQALQALHHPQLRTSTGTTVLQGLSSYQQMSSGGLSPYGAYDTTDPPSVTETAEAYPAFDGVAFPLPYVAPAPPSKPAPAAKGAVNRTSSGVGTQGISASGPATHKTISAYQGASAAGSVKASRRTGPPASQAPVSGTVVGASATPKLATRAGRPPAKDRSALYLALALLAVTIAGAVAERRRPRLGARASAVAVSLSAADRVRLAAIRRRALAPALTVLLGAGLVVLPAATGMWSRAPQGAVMIRAFHPYLQPGELSRLSNDVATLDAAFDGARAHGPALQFPHSAKPAVRFAAANPQLSQFEAGWPAIGHRFDALLRTMRSSRADYARVAALPSFRDFPWFVLAPGVLLLALGVAGLVWPQGWRTIRCAVLALGAALVLAPLALGMFSAGPAGARMLAAFRTVETRGEVTALQQDFTQLAIGQSALATELPAAVSSRIPAVGRLDARWISILNDLTPTLGVMSDNVASYQAVVALPPFTVFPWLFAGPGLVAIFVALLARPRLIFIPIRLRAVTKHKVQARSSV